MGLWLFLDLNLTWNNFGLKMLCYYFFDIFIIRVIEFYFNSVRAGLLFPEITIPF